MSYQLVLVTISCQKRIQKPQVSVRPWSTAAQHTHASLIRPTDCKPITNSQINSLGCFIRVQKLLFIMFCYGLHLQLIVSSAPSCLQEKFWILATYTDYISLYLQPWTQSMLWCTLTEGKTQLLGSGWNIIIDCFSIIII